MATKKPRKQSKSPQPRSLEEQPGLNKRVPRRHKGIAVKGKLFEPFQQNQIKSLEEQIKTLRKDLEITKQSTSKSFSLKDLEQDPVYKYGVCITRLKDLFKTDQDVEEWLNSNESGLPQTPLQYLEEGEFELVEGLISMIEYGIPS
jgi:hypothetical protein